MNHRVPDFDIEEEDSIPTSSALNGSKKSSVAEEEEIMELLWQNGQVVAHSQSQRSLKKSHVGGASEQREIRSEEETTQAHQLFMQEDEMASWLHYPLEDSSFDRDFYGDLLYPAPVAAAVSAPPRQAVAVAPRPPVPPQRRLDSSIESQSSQQRYQNFSLFSWPKGRTEYGPSSSNKMGKESTVVDSNDTPLTTALESRVSCVADNDAQVSGGNIGCSVTATATNTSPAACELTVSSSPGGSGASVSAASAEPAYKLTSTAIGATAATTEDRKRKGREADDSECQSEDVDFESAHAKKQVRGSTSTKRSRAAEVHNLSERRRRDRINEKMKALQELIPRCSKSDKASMLDEAIEYLKSLQMQVQMMSTGCGMVPVMFPGVQQYMPPMGMGMGMSMDMGMNRPMVPFPSVLPGSVLQNPAAAPHLAPRFPMPSFHMPPVSLPDPSRIQATSQSDLMLNSLASQNPNQARMSNFANPYQQYLGLHQAQVPLAQNQEPNPRKPNSSREGGNPDNRQSG